MSEAEATSSHSPVAPGYRLDRYELICPIAEGGMASVWVARMRGKRGFEKLVAIKTILPKYAQDPRFEKMFLDEAGLAARIEHPNVTQILDLGEEQDVLFLAMELVDGDSLSRLLRIVQKKDLSIPPGIALRILADTCGGLHAAHELCGRDGEPLHVVHRDVSPQNILVTMNGTAKLIDFGIAKARDRMSEDTNDGMLKGKIHYMAPEQALGHPVDRRADVWAVGAILYYLLVGKPPFEGENHLATLHLLVSGRPAPPLPPTVHPAISAVARRALSHDRDARFASAAALQAALESAMIDARLATTTTHVASFVREHMSDRANKRREAMDLALSAAAQREQVARLVEKAGADSASGHPEASDSHSAALRRPADRAESSAPSGRASVLSESSQATLGSAMASPVPQPAASHRLRSTAAVIAGALLLGVGVAAGFVVRSREIPRSTATTPPPLPEPPPTMAPLAPEPPSAPAEPKASAATASPPSNGPASAAPSASVSPRPVRATPPPHKPQAAPTIAPPSPAPARQRVNDGF